MELNEKTIYRIKIEDVQNVARRVFGRTLNEKELAVVEDNVGDYIVWHEAIQFAISNHLNLEEVGTMFDEEEEE